MTSYFRFIVGKYDQDSGRAMGVFQAASELLNNVELTNAHREAIGGIQSESSDTRSVCTVSPTKCATQGNKLVQGECD